MVDNSSRNKRIAKNSIVLYFRMIVIMLVTLYTTRVVLRVLGASDYGIYDVVGGIIGMLGYVNTILSGSVSRFLTVSLGLGDASDLRKTFSMCNTISIIGVFLVLVLGETFGLGFVYTQLNIPTQRLSAAVWIYQSAILSAVIVLLKMPYSACIIAHENMSVYGVTAIIDAFLRLGIVFALMRSTYDKLVLYAILLFLVAVVDLCIYIFYCKLKYIEVNFKLSFERSRLKDMSSYSGWSMIGAFANVLNNYGITILLNLFFGPLVNAARGVAAQVNMAIQKLYSSFQTASKPQIFKYYAEGDYLSMTNLIINTSKFSGFLIICIVIPLCIHIEGILSIWLGEDNVPDYAVAFVRCLALQSFLVAIDLPVGFGIQAVGKMKLPNLTTSFLYLIVFPITYLALKFGTTPIISYMIFIAFSPLILVADLWILNKYINFCWKRFVKCAILPLVYVAACCFIIPLFVESFFSKSGYIYLACKISISVIFCLFFILILGLTRNQRILLKKFIKKSIK